MSWPLIMVPTPALATHQLPHYTHAELLAVPRMYQAFLHIPLALYKYSSLLTSPGSLTLLDPSSLDQALPRSSSLPETHPLPCPHSLGLTPCLGQTLVLIIRLPSYPVYTSAAPTTWQLLHAAADPHLSSQAQSQPSLWYSVPWEGGAHGLCPSGSPANWLPGGFHQQTTGWREGGRRGILLSLGTTDASLPNYCLLPQGPSPNTLCYHHSCPCPFGPRVGNNFSLW